MLTTYKITIKATGYDDVYEVHADGDRPGDCYAAAYQWDATNGWVDQPGTYEGIPPSIVDEMDRAMTFGPDCWPAGSLFACDDDGEYQYAYAPDAIDAEIELKGDRLNEGDR